MEALYRKYRSKSLDEVVGQEHITKTLAGSIKAGRINHAYLFTGPRGTGKTSVARILAHEINKLPYDGSTKLDIIEIDAASNRRIDDIRELREKVHISPVNSAYKVYIIDEVHMLTGESFNALLKTLEEPPSHVVFILATTEAHKLPATIISRTQRFSFRSISPESAKKHLKEIAKKENIKVSDDAMSLIVEHGNGSLRDSTGLLDQLSNIKGGNIETEDVVQLVGLAPQKQLQNLTDAVLGGDLKTVASLLQQLEMDGANINSLIVQLSRFLAIKAKEKPELYQLVDNLLDISKASNPSLKLLTTLMLFANKYVKKSAALNVASPIKTEIKLEAPKKLNIAEPEKIPETPTEPIKSNDVWLDILAQIKTTSPPFYAILRQAEPIFEGSNLKIKFRSSLHAKYLDDAKRKLLFTGVLKSRLGDVPTIIVLTDKSVVPPKTELEKQVEAVTDIMGGGEVI